MRGELHRMTGLMLLIALAAGICAGCGGEFSGHSRERTASGGAVSGGAVSGGAVSGGAVWEEAVSGGAVKKIPVEKRRKKDRDNWFFSENNFYYLRKDEGGRKEQSDWVLMERDLSEGTEREISRKDVNALCYVDDDWVYYVVWDESKDPEEDSTTDSLYRAPIEKNRLNIQKEQRLMTDKKGINICAYCDGRYLLYITNSGIYQKYDLKEKRFIGNLDRDERNYDSRVLSVVDGYVYLRMGEEEGFYWQKLDSEEITKISGEMVWGEAHAAIGKDVYYSETYAMPFSVMKYNVEDGSREKAVSEKQLRGLLLQNGLLPEDAEPDEGYYPIGMFMSGKRLYMQFEIIWQDKKDVCSRHILVYLEPESGGELHYDKVLTECLAYKKPRRKWNKELSYDRYYSRGRCVEMTDERCYMEVCHPESDKITLACYDFQSGEFMYLTEEDLDWYLPYFTAPFRNIEIWEEVEALEGKDRVWPYYQYE